MSEPETPECDKKETQQPASPCSEPPTGAVAKIMELYEQVDTGKLPIEDCANQITEVLKAQREKKLECLKKLNL